MKYHVPQREEYNKNAGELYFIMGDDGVVYPARFELIHGTQYLKKIGADDENYYYFGGDHRYALAMKVKYENPDGSTHRNQQEIYFKFQADCLAVYKKLLFAGVTQDGGKIIELDYGMYNSFIDW